MEIEKIKFSAETEFHMLRHFEHINERRIVYLKSKGYDLKTIKEQLEMPSSKFSPDFATDVASLLKRIQKWDLTIIESDPERIVVEVEAPALPAGVGRVAVMAIANLTKQERSRIYQKNNRGATLSHLLANELPTTNLITLVLKISDGISKLITAYPGEAGMPIPNKNMNTEFFDKCTNYWSKHVFLEKDYKIIMK